MDCSPPGSSVHEILQATVLEWVAISFSRGSSRPRDWTQVSSTAGRFFTNWATIKLQISTFYCIFINKCFVLLNKILGPPLGLKLNIQKTKIMASGPITSWQLDGETVETVADFISLGSKITTGGDCSHEIKRCLLLGRKVMTNLTVY